MSTQQTLQESAATTLADRFGREDVPIRNAFIASSDDHVPPLAELVRSGRGWDARLRTYLTILWGALPPSHALALGAAAYAQVAGISSARQVRSAINSLVEHQLLEIVDDTPGRSYIIRPLHESGNGKPYTAPYNNPNRRGRQGFDNLYIKIPVGLWTNGWITQLPGHALATLLIYTQLRSSKPRAQQTQPVWLSPGLAHKRYGVSDDTRFRGLSVLADLGLATVETQGHAKPPYRATNRQMVLLHTDRLNELPDSDDERSPATRRTS